MLLEARQTGKRFKGIRQRIKSSSTMMGFRVLSLNNLTLHTGIGLRYFVLLRLVHFLMIYLSRGYIRRERQSDLTADFFA